MESRTARRCARSHASPVTVQPEWPTIRIPKRVGNEVAPSDLIQTLIFGAEQGLKCPTGSSPVARHETRIRITIFPVGPLGVASGISGLWMMFGALSLVKGSKISEASRSLCWVP